jgi:putative IMPACT (imprinted ancient) family translation regulator
MATKRRHSPDPPEGSSPRLASSDYYESLPIEDRSSKFVGFFSTTKSAKDLKNLTKLKTATHRMTAWRRPSSQRTLSLAPNTTGKVNYDLGSDDDGEKYGGRHIEKVLTEQNVEGSVVVARWYGGVLLGPARFIHIENAARSAIVEWKKSTFATAKKPKTETESEEKGRLITNLRDRDESIKTLRKLLADRLAANNADESANTTVESSRSSSPRPILDYFSMPLQRLRQLDKARDATIAWILKQIDAAETKSVSLQEADPLSAK